MPRRGTAVLVTVATPAWASTDAFETRANVIRAMQGHVLGTAVYVGLVRRPQ